VREFPLAKGHGFVDYLLFVDGKPVAVLEAKPVGHTLSGVQVQAQKYAGGLPDTLSPPVRPLPFLYVSTGTETQFTNLLDPEPRSRRVFDVHRPETLAEWLSATTLSEWTRGWVPTEQAGDTAAEVYQRRPSSLRSRLRAMPPVDIRNLWPNKKRAIENLERSPFVTTGRGR
jgi:type I restriction enzyme R subunit